VHDFRVVRVLGHVALVGHPRLVATTDDVGQFAEPEPGRQSR
jgi:hypothetical protein